MSEKLTSTIERNQQPHLSYELGKDAVRETVENPDRGFDAKHANYEGNWSELALHRMASPDFRQKFITYIEQSAQALPKPAEVGVSIAKGANINPDQYRTDRIDNYDDNHAKVASRVDYAPAANFGKKPSNHGTSPAYGEPGAVFSDSDLTARQKDIIAAHEMHHSLVDSKGSAPNSIVLPAFDTAKIAEWNDELHAAGSEKRAPLGYMSDPKELMARMAQLKNYYGMSGEERFTQEHLDHAKEHYVADTELDNNMTLFFRMIRDEEFIDAINRLPV